MQLALDPDASAVQLHELLGDAEPEPGAAEVAGGGRVDLPELREGFEEVMNQRIGLKPAEPEPVEMGKG